MLMTLLMVSLLSTAPTEAPAEDVYVTVDMVRVREGPGESTTPKGKLRINTAVQVLEENGGWSRVRLESHGFEGWVLSRFLGPEEVSAEALKKQLLEAKGAERVGILERLVALEPNVAEHYRGLQKAYQEAGNAERAKLLASRLKGDMPLYFATCTTRAESNRTFVVASYRKGKLAAVPRKRVETAPATDAAATAGAPEDAAVRDEAALKSLAADLSGAFWAQWKKGGPEVEPGTPFPEPSVSKFNYREYGGEQSPDGASYVTVFLGSCTGGDWVSEPVEVVQLTPEQKKRLAGHDWGRSMLDEAVWVRPLFGDGSIFAVINVSHGSKHYGYNETCVHVSQLTPDNKSRDVHFPLAYWPE
jgi:uncharacterized protein YgiM (DUF1202 family)